MRKKVASIITVCAVCTALSLQAQSSSSGSSSGTTPGSSSSGSSSSSYPGSSGGLSGQSSSSGSRYSATGRMGQQEIRASKLTGSEVRSSSGEQLGTINDVVINPNSGRIDFAVLS